MSKNSLATPLNSLQIASRLDELPTLPSIVYELSRVIDDPMSSTSEVEAIMSGDQAMTTKVLQLANSAYYAIPGGVTSLKRAIAYIGYDAIYQLVLASSVIKALKVNGATGFDLKAFWKHSLGVGMASETIGKVVGVRQTSDLFTCGLVHDMGKIALLCIAPEQFESTSMLAEKEAISFVAAETQLDSPRHAQIGYLLTSKWKLPSIIQATVQHHHHWDVAQRGVISAEMNQAVDIVMLANLLTHALQFGHSGHTKVEGVPKEIIDRLRLNSDSLKKMIAKIKETLESSANSFLQIIEGSP